MRRQAWWFVWSVSLILALPAVAGAQSAIAGTARDTTGGVLPGVTVEASSPALIEKVRTTVTNDEGQYKILDLRPGEYVVSFSLAGFTTVKHSGLVLPAAFTAMVNADMRVGDVVETVTVSGQAPVVDVQTIAKANVLTREFLDALPSNKMTLGFAAVTPGASLPLTSQAVGGNTAGFDFDTWGIHGSRAGDMLRLLDGMRWNVLEGGASGVGFSVVSAGADQVELKLGGNSAEFELGGVQMNLIPKEGGNRFNGYGLTNYSSKGLVSSNLTDADRARGLTGTNKSDVIWDFTGTLGGPIKKDKLWFFTLQRTWGRRFFIAGNYFNADPKAWTYTPDLNRPAVDDNRFVDNGFRVTWQASPKNKIAASYDVQRNKYKYRLITPLDSPEATLIGAAGPPNDLSQVTWKYPATNRLLLDAGVTTIISDAAKFYQPDTIGEIGVTEQRTGRKYRAFSGLQGGHQHSNQTNQRFAVAYVTGAHALRAGLQTMMGWRTWTDVRTGDLSYAFLDGAPTQITQWASPLEFRERLKMNLGVFVQDAWTMSRLTLHLGGRIDYLNAFVPTQHLDAGPFVAARDFGKVPCVPCWTDFSPRLGAAYDVFGNGRTAVKFNLGRFVAGETLNTARASNPAVTSVNSITRTWADANGDFAPQGDLRNPNANAELGAISNRNFGLLGIATIYAPEVLKGWNVRPYDWQLSSSLEHEIRPWLAVNVSYFRTWYGNFTVTDNQDVTSGDFTTFAVTAPAASALPGGGGYLVTGLYDVNPDKFGQVHNVVRQASAFGRQTEVFDGFDFLVSLRGRSSQMTGGVTTGRTVTDQCFVVDSPQQLLNCHVVTPFSAGTQLKFSGAYALPWSLRVSGTIQNLSGPPTLANYVVTSAQVQASLGRPLASGARGTATVPLVVPNSLYLDGRVNQVDLRVAKLFRPRKIKLEIFSDLFNAFNTSPILSLNNNFGPAWRNVTQILSGRIVDFGLQANF